MPGRNRGCPPAAAGKPSRPALAMSGLTSQVGLRLSEATDRPVRATDPS